MTLTETVNEIVDKHLHGPWLIEGDVCCGPPVSRKPCTYHEGWLDGVLYLSGMLAIEDRPASRVDRLRVDGWETCPNCEDGLDRPTPSFSESHPLPVPCPECAHGLVPPEWMVEAAADELALYAGYESIGPGPNYWRGMARVALVAAARAGKEK